MVSRRSVLAAVAAAGTTAIAGCSLPGAGDESRVSPEQVLTQGVARAGNEQNAGSGVGGARVKFPSRVAEIEQLPQPVIDYQLRDYYGDLQPDDVELSIAVNSMNVEVGSFSTQQASWPEFSTYETREPETALDAKVQYYTEFVHRVHVSTDGVMIDLILEASEAETPSLATRIERRVGPVLAAIDGSGDESLFSEGANAKLSDELGKGFYTRYWNLGSDSPMGLTVAADGDVARRRIVQVWSDATAAANSQLLDEQLRAEIAARDYQLVDADLEPFRDVNAERDGRIVETEATLPLDRLVVTDFNYPPSVLFDPSSESE